MSSINEDQVYSFNEMTIFGTLNEQCLMVDQKYDDATMLSQSTITALEPLVSDDFDFTGNANMQILDLNDDIYASIMNEDVLSSETGCNGKLFSECSFGNKGGNSPDDGVLISAPNSVPSFHVELFNSNTNICQPPLLVKPLMRSSDDSSEVKSSNSFCETTTKTRRRRRCAPTKEKLYMKTEPFSDEEQEKKRLNAQKARKNREKQKVVLDAMKTENANLRDELQSSKFKIQELEKVVADLQDKHQQKKLRLCHWRDQFNAIIDE